MDEGIRLEPVLHPQVGGNVGVGWGGVGPMHDLESIVPGAGSILGHQDDVPELQAGNPQFAVRRGHVMSGKLPVGSHDFRVFFRAEGLLHPRLVLFLAD